MVAGNDARGHVWTVCSSSNAIVLSYCHHPVARFPRQQLGRQSKYGWHGGDLGGVNNGQFGIVHVCIQPTGQICRFQRQHTGPINVVDERVQGYWLGGSVGGVICPQPEVLIGTMGLWRHNNVQWLRVNDS